MNSPSNQSITESFDEQKCDSKENIDGDEYPILWYNLEKSLEEKFDKIHSFSQVEEMYKFAKSLNVNFMMIIPRDYDEEGLSRDFSEFKDIHIERLLKTEEEMILKHFGQETSDPSFKVCLFYTLEDFERESPIDPNEYEVTMMKDIKEMAKEFREEFAILWYDCNLGCEMKEKVVNKLDIEEKNIYKNFEELLERMNKPNELPYHLILTGKKYDELKEIIDRDLLLGLYVYGSDDNKFASAKSPKIRVENTLEDLTPKIQEGIRTNSKIKSDLPAFTTDFDTEDRSKIYNLHNNLQGLINFRNRKQAKADFLNLIKKMYPRSQKITDFEQEYNDYDKGKILFWYTKDSPIYRVLNNSLRIATADSILCCRFMLKDLERAIREEYQLKNRDFSGAVYRGAFVSASEWEKLQRNVGKEIEMYGFLSTSADKKAATNFLANAPQDKIFITIIIPPLPELDSQGFANVSEFSEFKKENEILFNVRSRFKILQAQDPARKNGYRHLVLLFGSKLLRRNMTQEKPEISLDLAFCAQDCEGCGKRENLFGYKQEKTQVRCLECLQQDSIVEDVPLLSLSFQGSEKVLEGRISNFKSKVGFENSGYQCADCGDIGKKRYYRWINIEEKSDIKQCDGCFKSKKGEIKGESSPFVFWQEEQEEWEKIESKHKEENQESLQFLNEGEVYLQLRDYKKALGYGKRVLEELLFKRFKEIEKLRAYNLIAYCLQGLGNNKEALLYWTKRLEITRFRKGEMNPQTALEFMRLASCHESMSHFQEAVDFGMKSLEIMKLYYGENHPEIGNSYDQIAIALMHLGKYQEAVEFSLKALDIWKSIYALEYSQKNLEISIAIYGENHHETAASYNNIALAYNISGDFKKAEELHKKAAKIWKLLGGEHHFSLASSYNNIATVYANMQKHEKALEYALRSVEIWKLHNGDNHSGTATSYDNIATIYGKLEEYEKQFDYRLKVVEIRIMVFGKDHSEVTSSFENLLDVYDEFISPQNALNLCLKALEVWKAVHEGKDLKAAALYKKISIHYFRLEKYFDALEYYSKVLEIKRSVHGEEHFDVGKAYNDLGVAYAQVNEYEKALECHKEALRIKQKTCPKTLFGATHRSIISSYMDIACIYEELRQYPQAILYYERAINEIPLFMLLMGDSLTTVEAYRGLYRIHRCLGDFTKALDYGNKVLEIQQKSYNDRHPRVAEAYIDIGVIYNDIRDYERAQDYFIKGKETLETWGDLFNPQLKELEHLKIIASDRCRLKKESDDGRFRNVIKFHEMKRKKKSAINYSKSGKKY